MGERTSVSPSAMASARSSLTCTREGGVEELTLSHEASRLLARRERSMMAGLLVPLGGGRWQVQCMLTQDLRLHTWSTHAS